MKISRSTIAILASAVFALSASRANAQAAEPAASHVLRAAGDHFELDGKPFQIISGAIHYSRVPRAYWRDRLRKARAMGLNTVETYVFWNLHEPTPGHFDFSGDKDIAEFIREAQQEGLYVILRPGPYVCAEWEFGGYPAWLLRDPTMQVRTSNPAFIAAATRWLHRLGQELAPLQSGNGGPIIAVQVENEYGSFGSDHNYMEQIHHILVDAGFTKSMLYTADGADELANGSLPELPAVINFGTGDAKTEFAKLAKLRPNAPKMCGEYWDGWFDHYGDKHHTASGATEAAEVKWMLQQGYSVNLYMFHGGTSFGWMNGANSNGKNYEPDTTSYDYDAPVSEDGALAPKFQMLRDAIREATGVTPPDPPASQPLRTFPPVQLAESASLWDNLPAPTKTEEIQPMENLGQSYGYILYRNYVTEPRGGELRLDDVHSYAQVYLDGAPVGSVDRRLDQTGLQMKVDNKGARLDILVENTGRVNYGHQFVHERAGITRQVWLGRIPFSNWENYSLPMDAVSSLPFKSAPCTGPCFYRGTFTVDEPGDTYLDVRSLTKGEVFVNGRALGRAWNVGPQGALYLPAPWLHKGENEVIVFDYDGKPGRTLDFVAHPVLDLAAK